MDNFCRAHFANHSEKTCKEFMDVFKTIICPPSKDKEWDEDEEDEEEDEYEEEEHIKTTNVYWDYTPRLDFDDEPIGEIFTNVYNLQSKWTLASTNSPSTISPSKKSTYGNKTIIQGTNGSKKASQGKSIPTPNVACLNYNVVVDLKKMKANIPMYELSKIAPQQELLKAWRVKYVKSSTAMEKGNSIVNNVKTSTVIDKRMSSSSMVATYNKIPYINNVIMGKKYKSITPPFLLTFDILIWMFINAWLILDIHLMSYLMMYARNWT